MTHTLRRAGWPFLGLLVALLLLTRTSPALAEAPLIPRAADDPPVKGKDAPKADDKAKAIADVEKQIADLQKKLDELKKGPATPPKAAAPEGVLPDDYVKALNWRSIGPASMGGRVTCLAVVESDPTTYYVGTASGGLLKTTNNGTTFAHLFDNQATVSVGDVAVAPSDPNVVWVGTGENNPRNSVTYGDGVYKSLDAGKTFTNMGLKKSFSVGKVVIHPKDPNTVYVGAMGRLYGPNEERGLFKTTDGGKTWTKALYVDDRTGVIDFRMDPANPEVLIVATWERKRDAFDGFFGEAKDWPAPDQYGPEVTYGPGGGLHKTADGGKTWKKLKAGLPTVKTGRIGLDYARKAPGLVYAVIDTEKLGIGPPVSSVIVGVGLADEKGGGVKVNALTDDGPAAKAGIKEGDVLVSFDGTKLTDRDSYTEFLVTKKPGDVVKVAFTRDGKDMAAEVKLIPKPAANAKPGANAPQMPLPGFSPTFKPDGGGPVTVGYVPTGSAAEKAGVKPGMTVAGLEGKDVVVWADFRNPLRDKKAGDKVKLKFKDNDKTFEAELTVAIGPVVVAPANPDRPNLLSNVTGGQTANIQDQQGKGGFEAGGVFVSKDNGETWTRVNSVNPRPFYFSQVRVDPSNDDNVYLLGDVAPGFGNQAGLWRSTNGGKTFGIAPNRRVHADIHAMWIDPRDARHMILGCDGGFYATYDRGDNWDHLNVLALGQFYHVAVDNRRPYRVYGGLQDNGSWAGPSHTLRGSGPVNEDWSSILGGDGFVCRVDPNDPDIIYAESQNGNMARANLRTGERAGIRPGKPDEPMRWNWNTPFILSAHSPGVFYCASQYVFRSLARGDSSKPISPEITRTKQGSGTALAESPRNPEVLWAGTDDGFVWITKDGGAKWENLFEKFKPAGLPGPRWVASIEPSRAVEGRCYVVLDAHRSDDDKPYVFATEDFGATWKSITANLPAFGSTRVLREDYTNPNLLYLGTEFGVWVSINRGTSWTRINNNLPTVPVHEVAQPTTASEIVVATHGRSVWIVDVASLRQLPARTDGTGAEAVTYDPLKDAVTLFTPAPAVRWKIDGGRGLNMYSQEARKFYGTNPERRATIEYLLKAPAKALTVKITDAAGKPVFDFRTAVETSAGFHRLNWSLNRIGGGAVPAGTYRVVLNADGKEYAQAIVVENDPNADPRALVGVAEGEMKDEEEEGDPVEREFPGWKRVRIPVIED